MGICREVVGYDSIRLVINPEYEYIGSLFFSLHLPIFRIFHNKESFKSAWSPGEVLGACSHKSVGERGRTIPSAQVFWVSLGN